MINVFVIAWVFFWTNYLNADVAVIGDELVNGYFSSPEDVYDSSHSWKILTEGKSSNAPQTQMKVLALNDRFFANGQEWFVRNVTNLVYERVYYNLQNSALVKASRSLDPQGSIVVATNPKLLISDMDEALSRFTKSGLSKNYGYILVSLSTTELCRHPSQSHSTAEELKTKYFKLMQKLDGEFPTASKVVLIAPQHLATIIANDHILAKKITAFGITTTCGEFRKNDFLIQERLKQQSQRSDVRKSYFSGIFPPHYATSCPNLFTHDFKSEETLTTIANAQRESRKALNESVDQWRKQNQQASVNRFTVIEDLANMNFADQDIANDCVHFSDLGHSRISDAIVQKLSN